MRIPIIGRFVWLGIVLFILAACAENTAVNTLEPTRVTVEEPVLPTETIQADNLPTSTKEPTSTSLPEVIEVTPSPIPRTELFATDPTTVELASGRIQLIKFFAFW